MGDEYKAGADEIAKAMAEIQKPAPEVDKPTESKQEPQLEEKMEEEVKTEPEDKEEEKPAKEEPKPEPKSVKKDNSVPLIKFIQEEKKRKQLEKEIEEMKKQPKAEPSPKANPQPQKLADIEQAIYDLAVQNGWTQQQYEAEVAKTRAIYAPITQELEELRGLKEQAKIAQEQKEVEVYVDNKISEIDSLIEKEHGENALLVKNKLKEKILKEGLETVPIEYIYNGDSSFRAPPQKKTVESSRGGKSDYVDQDNPTVADIKSGKVDPLQLLERWKNK